MTMTERTRRILASVGLALGFAALTLILTLCAIHAVGTDAGLYFREQTQEGILPSTGLTRDGLRALDSRLADYLRGDRQALEADPPFNDREMAHMRDCFGLFELLRKVRARLIPWAALLIALGAWLLQDRRRVRLCAWLAPLMLLVPLGAFAVYAASDFDAAFTLFHKILFRNDLWLLDPRTDLLIRICPERMFMHMGARIGLYSLASLLAVPALTTLLTLIRPGNGKENPWKTTTRRAPAPKQYDFGKKGTR